MGIAKFIENVKATLGLDEFEKSTKKKSVKSLLKKLNSKKEKVINSIKKELNEKTKKDLEEELVIISLHIKKADKILQKF